MIKKHLKKIITIIIILIFVLVIVWLYMADFGKNKEIEFGASFSQKYTEELKLDWEETLAALLDDLGIRKFRLVAHWDLIEKQMGIYDFSDLEKQIQEVAKRGGQVTLAIGHRTPRWPECHWPNWIYNLSKKERDQHILDLLTETVNHFKEDKTIVAWQVDNEPFLRIFGECPKPDNDFYKKEIALVRSLDSRPIVVTESGELSTWLRGSILGNQLGVSVYRITWNKWIGYFYYPLPPAYYYLKSNLVKLLTDVDKIFVSELQMEPWLAMPILSTSLEEQYYSMNIEKFNKNISYIKRTGFDSVYLWGVEWWYWLKEQGDDTIWNEAKGIWKD